MGKYDDIIDKPYAGSRRGRMTMKARAAQFSAFAAVTGHDAAVKEMARLTDSRIEVGEDLKRVIDGQLQQILRHIQEQPEVTFTFFRPDERKEGGSYVTVTGTVRNFDQLNGVVVLQDKTRIPICEILSIDSEIFPDLEAHEAVYSHLAQANDDIELGRIQCKDSAFADIIDELENMDYNHRL